METHGNQEHHNAYMGPELSGVKVALRNEAAEIWVELERGTHFTANRRQEGSRRPKSVLRNSSLPEKRGDSRQRSESVRGEPFQAFLPSDKPIVTIDIPGC